jgi:hypothetical protein
MLQGRGERLGPHGCRAHNPMGPILLLMALAFVACGTEANISRREPDAEPGRGSQACKDWQDAICDYAADRCGLTARKACDDQYQGATCQADARAIRCATLLDAADCGLAPAECMLDAIADPEPARLACGRLVEAFCTHDVGCGSADNQQQCLANPNSAQIDCTRALSYGLEYDQCLADIEAWTCDASKPVSCDKVIVLRKQS